MSKSDAEIKVALRAAIAAAIDEIGMEALKRTSMFPLSNRKRETEMKLAA